MFRLQEHVITGGTGVSQLMLATELLRTTLLFIDMFLISGIFHRANSSIKKHHRKLCTYLPLKDFNNKYIQAFRHNNEMQNKKIWCCTYDNFIHVIIIDISLHLNKLR